MSIDENDTEVEQKVIPNLEWKDPSLHHRTLESLNYMRRNKQFCDVSLMIGKHRISAHRAVLAAASPYLFELFTSKEDQPTSKEEGTGILYELNGGFDRYALECLIDYAYTAHLKVTGDKVRIVYAAAIRLKMDRAACECARFLISSLGIASCLDTRSLTGNVSSKVSSEWISKVDDYICEHLNDLRISSELRSLPLVSIEILHNCKEELEAILVPNLCQLSLDWIHQQWKDDQNMTLQSLVQMNYLLCIGNDNTLTDCCEGLEIGSIIDSEIIQDYKKVYRILNVKGAIKNPRSYSIKPSKPRELLYSRHINQEEARTEERYEDWKVIASMQLEDDKKSIVSVATVNGQLITLSILQRINTPSISLPNSNSTSPKISRPSSMERDDYERVSVMNEAKCAVGAGCMKDTLIICGGYDRGECLNDAAIFDPKKNKWIGIKSLIKKRGRFGMTVTENDMIYAVGGSDGSSELKSAEKYNSNTNQWSLIGSLPIRVSSVGVCSLNGRIYCIGGLYGQSGTKHCFRLNEEETEWEKIAPLNMGRSQAAVASFQGRIWVVGGCNTWNPLNSVEVYDPVMDSWKYEVPMLTPRRGCGLVARNGSLIVIGGSDGTHSLCTTEIFDPSSKTWTVGPNMTSCRNNVATAVVNGQIWAVGGFSGKFFLNTMEYLDTETNEWTTFINGKKLSHLQNHGSCSSNNHHISSVVCSVQEE